MLSSIFHLTLLVVNTLLTAPNGLNLIPTADVYEPGIVSLEFQTDAEKRPFGTAQTRYALLQFGVAPGIEFGVDNCINKAESSPLLNAKFRLWNHTRRRPAVAIGVQNICGSTAQPYLVAGFGLDNPFRFHIGTIAVDGAKRGLLGIDYTWKRFTLQGDWISGKENALGLGISWCVQNGINLTYSWLIPNASEQPALHLFNIQYILRAR
ncbi:MAG: hypothetical protein ACP5R4_07620 [Armatimonadota bacterium]